MAATLLLSVGHTVEVASGVAFSYFTSLLYQKRASFKVTSRMDTLHANNTTMRNEINDEKLLGACWAPGLKFWITVVQSVRKNSPTIWLDNNFET